MINLKKFKRFLYKSLLQNFQYNKENNTYTFFSDTLCWLSNGLSEISNIDKENKRKIIIFRLQDFYFTFFNYSILFILFLFLILAFIYSIFSSFFNETVNFFSIKIISKILYYSFGFPCIYLFFQVLKNKFYSEYKLLNTINSNHKIYLNSDLIKEKILKIYSFRKINFMSFYFLIQKRLIFYIWAIYILKSLNHENDTDSLLFTVFLAFIFYIFILYSIYKQYLEYKKYFIDSDKYNKLMKKTNSFDIK